MCAFELLVQVMFSFMSVEVPFEVRCVVAIWALVEFHYLLLFICQGPRFSWCVFDCDVPSQSCSILGSVGALVALERFKVAVASYVGVQTVFVCSCVIALTTGKYSVGFLSLLLSLLSFLTFCRPVNKLRFKL